MKKAIINGAIFDGECNHLHSALIVEDERILALISDTDPALEGLAKTDLNGRLLAPGFIDIQLNGGGDVLFGKELFGKELFDKELFDKELSNKELVLKNIKKIAAAHRQFGTCGFLLTLISADLKTIKLAIEAVDQAIKQKVPGVLGIHIEGPFLNKDYAGIHAADKFLSLDDEALSLLCSLQSGLTMLTLAPECTTSEKIKQLKKAGIIVCGGHSSASFDEVQLALKAGLSGFTHLYNAMSPFTSRAPGMVGAALADKNSWAGIIADGIHIHPAAFAIAVAAKPRGQVILVTDAMPVVGGKRDQFEFEGETITVTDGRCQNEAGVLAGSALDMNTAVINAMSFANLDLQEALRMASTYPAAALGLGHQLGKIKPGYKATFVELNDEHRVYRTWIDGELSV